MFVPLSSVTIRLKSIKNIQKITKSMKMVAAAKYARAERQLKPARVYGSGALGMSNTSVKCGHTWFLNILGRV